MIVCSAIARRAVLFAVLSLAASGTTAIAHHGGGFEYHDEAIGPLTGVVTEFAFRFPHVQIFFDVKDASGEVVHWAMVTRWTPTILRQHGWTRHSIKPGDTVTFTYSRHVEQPAVGEMRTVEVNGEPLDLDF